MTYNMFLATLRKMWGRLLLFGAVGAALSFFVLVVASPRFQVGSDYLIVQTQANTQDTYSLFKSLDYLGKVMNESVYSERFIGAVVDTGRVNVGFLPSDSYDRLKAWKKMVVVTRNADAGILRVEVRSDDQRLAMRVSQAVSDVLVQKNAMFRGGDDASVEIRVLSGPVVENNPSVREIALALIGGFVAAIFLTLLWIVIRLEMSVKRTVITQ